MLDDNKYRVFLNKDVVKHLGDNLIVHNSEARTAAQFADQKVVFKYEGNNAGELEMRNDSQAHYQEVRFNMNKPRVMQMLYRFVPHARRFNDEIVVYGAAIKTFGNWER